MLNFLKPLCPSTSMSSLCFQQGAFKMSFKAEMWTADIEFLTRQLYESCPVPALHRLVRHEVQKGTQLVEIVDGLFSCVKAGHSSDLWEVFDTLHPQTTKNV
ncbi:hypothetical protein CEXT_70491 [Caerostris extrusa]|uniref:Uncharacterized protein n=1 Tax=Caerostris extrusa TaxID=172846 RepID=A0AAV4R1J5_CAEEX|nr:hypothetical protein CEXT_70491 [Caerostris extrusa]